MRDGIDEFFEKYVFPGIGFISAVFVMLLFILSSIDIMHFTVSQIVQDATLRLNPNMLNKDAIDYELLKYSKYIKENEPYNIYIQQLVAIIIYWWFGWCIIIFLGFAFLKLISYFKNKNKAENKGVISPEQIKIDINEPFDFTKMVVSLIIMLIVAIAYSGIYDSTFIKQIKPHLYEITTNIKGITDVIYDNMSTNEAFLKSVVEGNENNMYKILNQQGDTTERMGSMIFTICLYNYYKKNTSIKFNENIKNIFTTTQIRLRKIEPFDYLYYNQTSFVPNLYPEIEKKLPHLLNTYSKRSAVRQNVTQRLNDVNRRLVTMFRMSAVKNKVVMYMLICCIIAMVGVFILGNVYKDLGKSIYNFVKNVILKNKNSPPI